MYQHHGSVMGKMIPFDLTLIRIAKIIPRRFSLVYLFPVQVIYR